MDRRITDMSMPAAVVTRILKDENISASKESRDTISRAAAVFLINLSGLACGNAKDANHKTISADDVVRALKTFDNDAIYTHCKQAVTEWKVLKQQRVMARKNLPTSNEDVVEESPQLEM